MPIVIFKSRNNLISQLMLRHIDIKIFVRIKEIGIFKFMKSCKHGFFITVVAVNNRYRIGKIRAVYALCVNCAA